MTNANTIGELAVAIPEAIPVLERLGIDYCCHGEQPVGAACNAAGITADELLMLIGSAEKTPATYDWHDEPLQGLMAYIVDAHHAYTRAALQTLRALAEKVRIAHGERHPELLVVERLIGELDAELIPHMMKEEQVLFPFIERELDVRNPVRMMMFEHEMAGETLKELRAAANDYALPGDACTSYKALFARLIEFEADLHQHIHLENNILFPRALNEHQCRC